MLSRQPIEEDQEMPETAPMTLREILQRHGLDPAAALDAPIGRSSIDSGDLAINASMQAESAYDIGTLEIEIYWSR